MNQINTMFWKSWMICWFFWLQRCFCFHATNNWELFELDPGKIIDTNESMVELLITPNNTSVCIYENIEIQWKISIEKQYQFDVNDLVLGVYQSNNFDSMVSKIDQPSQILITPLSQVSTLDLASTYTNINPLPVKSMLIQCAIDNTTLDDDPYCVPRTSDILLQTNEHILTIYFQENTHITPGMLFTSQEINKAFVIRPSLTPNITGTWISPRQLNISLTTVDMEILLTTLQRKETVEIKVRTNQQSLSFEGKKTFTLLQHHMYTQFFVFNQHTNQLMSRMIPLFVQSCSINEPIPSVLSDSQLNLQVNQPFKQLTNIPQTFTKSLFSIKGIYPIAKKEPLLITSEVVPMMNNHSWSISFWIKLIEGPTGQHRSLFFKGLESDSRLRTPSAWLLPHSNHITLRVSTETEFDMGIYSTKELIVNQWTYLSFVFTNVTNDLIEEKELFDDIFDPNEANLDSNNVMLDPKESIVPLEKPLIERPIMKQVHLPKKKSKQTQQKSTNKPIFYEIELYINGELDVHASFPMEVLGTDGPLMMFKDLSFQGPRGFVTKLDIWNNRLTSQEITSFYRMGLSPEIIHPIDIMIDLLGNISNPLIPFTLTSETTMKTTEINLQNMENNDLLPSMNPQIIEQIIQRSSESIYQCESYHDRIDLHAESTEIGAIEGLNHWAKLTLFGFEISDSKCGFSSASQDIKQRQTLSKQKAHEASYYYDTIRSHVSSSEHTSSVRLPPLSIQEIDPLFRDPSRAILAYLQSIDRGSSEGLIPLAFALFQGIGLESIWYYDRDLAKDWDVPHPLHHTNERTSLLPLRYALGTFLTQSNNTCRYKYDESSLAMSSLCQQAYNHTFDYDINDLALGLLYLSALYGHVDAHVTLAHRYQHGLSGLNIDLELAAQYSLFPLQVSNTAFHTIGAQPLVELDRLNDETINEISKGNQGNDDELIQYQKIRAKEGDVPAMVAMGDLYYYGARGLPRDQVQALDYYTQAANHGDASGMCGAANMYLKGEGAPANVPLAIEFYENATKNGSIRAYNGLGYLYFYGQQVPKNDTKAYEYFLEAAKYENDGDALFNAAFCLEHGYGTEVNMTKAVMFYHIAAQRLGHFGSFRVLSQFYMEGKGVVRSASNALIFLNAAKSIGPWMGWIRRGFDLYLTTIDKLFIMKEEQLIRSLLCYLYVGELGVELGQSNAGYLLRSKLGQYMRSTSSISSSSTSLFLENSLSSLWKPTISSQSNPSMGSSSIHNHQTTHLLLGNIFLRTLLTTSQLYQRSESYVEIGNCYFMGTCGLSQKDYTKAMIYYQLASLSHNSLANAYLGVMNHFGIGCIDGPNLIRAHRYYSYALQPKSSEIITIQMKVFIQSLQMALSLKSYDLLTPVNLSIDYIIKMLWM